MQYAEYSKDNNNKPKETILCGMTEFHLDQVYKLLYK